MAKAEAEVKRQDLSPTLAITRADLPSLAYEVSFHLRKHFCSLKTSDLQGNTWLMEPSVLWLLTGSSPPSHSALPGPPPPATGTAGDLPAYCACSFLPFLFDVVHCILMWQKK